MSNEQTKKEIREAYLFLREENHTIPSEVLEFMRDAAIEKLNTIEGTLEKVDPSEVLDGVFKISPYNIPSFSLSRPYILEAMKKYALLTKGEKASEYNLLDTYGTNRSFLRHLIDQAWMDATESTTVPSTKWADELIVKSVETFKIK